MHFSRNKIKSVGQSFYVLTFLLFNLSSCHGHLFVFRHFKWQSFEIGGSYSQTLQWKLHNTSLSIEYMHYSNDLFCDTLCKWISSKLILQNAHSLWNGIYKAHNLIQLTIIAWLVQNFYAYLAILLHYRTRIVKNEEIQK